MEKVKNTAPSMDAWIKEAKADESAAECGMYLFHNGIVRQSAKAKVRQGDNEGIRCARNGIFL